MDQQKRTALSGGITISYLTLIVILPLAAICTEAFHNGTSSFIKAITNPQAVAALKLTFLCSLAVAAMNVVTGTALAFVLTNDTFRGKGIIELIVDMPFALPTIVASLTLLTLYGPKSPVGIDLAYTKAAILMALLFVTLPFVVRSVQPVLLELHQEPKEAAMLLGASRLKIFRSITLPHLTPAILSGASLSFSRAIGEFGSLVLLAGNLPFKTEYASIFIYGEIESDRTSQAAAVSTSLLAIALFFILITNVILRRRQKKYA